MRRVVWGAQKTNKRHYSRALQEQRKMIIIVINSDNSCHPQFFKWKFFLSLHHLGQLWTLSMGTNVPIVWFSYSAHRIWVIFLSMYKKIYLKKHWRVNIFNGYTRLSNVTICLFIFFRLTKWSLLFQHVTIWSLRYKSLVFSVIFELLDYSLTLTYVLHLFLVLQTYCFVLFKRMEEKSSIQEKAN